MKPDARHLVTRLIYPVPDPRFPFLGVHFTPRIDGEVWAGPNAVLAFAREGYRRRDIDVGDLVGDLTYPGFRRLARRHVRMGLAELWRDWSKRAFVAALQRYRAASSAPTSWSGVPLGSVPRRWRSTGRWSTTSTSAARGGSCM